MADYVRKPQLMIKKGMNVTLPGDRLAPEYFQYVRNARSFKIGEWRQRGGMILIYPSTGESISYLTRVNNNVTGTFRRFVGTNLGKVYVDNNVHTTLSIADSGYSGTNFSSVISRPDRSPLPYLFLADSLRQSKFSPTGTRTEWGLAAPISSPAPFLLSRLSTIVTALAAGYSVVNGAVSDQTRVSTTVADVLADGGGSSMISVVPTAMSENIAAGMVITTNASTSIVEDVFQPIQDTTIDSIVYDTGGAPGFCTIQLTTSTTGLRKDTLVRINSAETVRVLSVTDGLDGLPSFRCFTFGTFSAGQTVQGLRSFRCGPGGAVSVGNAITAGYVQLAVTAPGIASMTLTFAGEFNAAVAGNRPVQPEDFIHVSLRVSSLAVINEIQVQFDFDSTTNDFTRNYFFKSVRPPDFQSAISQTASSIQAQQVGITRTQIDDFTRKQLELEREELTTFFPLGPVDDSTRRRLDEINLILGSGFEIGQDEGPLSGEATSGDNQWTELLIPISQFQRVGSDMTRGWANIRTFRISVNTTGTPSVGTDGFWVGGTYGPNTLELPGYTYVYRARNSSTGARSNPSPPTRSPIYPKREQVLINVPSYPDIQADVFDFFRIGGTLGNFHYVGTALAGGQFRDGLPDSLARRNPLLEVDRFKPWPRSDLPKSGTCNVVGTRVTRSTGDVFNTAWVRGTQITIADRTYTLYSNPSSTTTLDLNESGGTQTGVAFQIPDPQLDGQPMPAVFGPYSGASGEFLFGCGDPTNPGYLYYTNGNDPESANDVNLIELCGPSEKLMNGVVLDGIVYCFSDRRSWRILPSFQGGQSGAGADFYPQETAMGKGLAARFGVCVGDAMYFVSFDGIYRSRGDAVESITDDSLVPLFNRDGTFIADFVTPVSTIDFGSPDDISLTYSFDGIYFSYKGRDAIFHTYFYSFLTQGWMEDTITTGQITRSLREIRTQDADNVLVGTTGGKVMIRSNSVFLDDVDSISCRVWDREEIWDDLRSTKQVGDIMVDIDPAGATIIPTLRYENNTSSDVLSSIAGSGRDQYVRDVNSGSGRIVRGAALDLTWSNGTGSVPRVYAWEPAAIIKSEESADRATDWDNAGYPGTKWLQGFRLRGDTLGVSKSFQVEIDGSPVSVEGFTFTANGEQVQTFSLTNPVVAHEFRIRGTDGDPWRNMGIEWIWEPEPEQAITWETQVTSLDLPFYSHIREVMIAHRSTTDITMSVITDGVTNVYTIPHGVGQRVRSYLPILAIKAKYHKFRFTSTAPFGMWINDIEVKAGAWGRGDAYNTIKPFGDVSRSNGGAKV